MNIDKLRHLEEVLHERLITRSADPLAVEEAARVELFGSSGMAAQCSGSWEISSKRRHSNHSESLSARAQVSMTDTSPSWSSL